MRSAIWSSKTETDWVALGCFEHDASLAAGITIETDGLELDRSQNDTAIYYWYETDTTPQTNAAAASAYGEVTTKTRRVRGIDRWFDTLYLPFTNHDSGRVWFGFMLPGDYQKGAFFYDRSRRQLTFLAQWLEPTSPPTMHTNVIAVPQ